MSRTRIPLDTYDWRPPELKQYLRNFGFHFNKKLAEFAISKMRKLNPTTNRLEKIEAVSKDKIDELMTPTKRTASFLIVGMPIAAMRVFQSNGMICYDTPAVPT